MKLESLIKSYLSPMSTQEDNRDEPKQELKLTRENLIKIENADKSIKLTNDKDATIEIDTKGITKSEDWYVDI